MTRGVKNKFATPAEIAFDKLGYRKKEGHGVIVYYKVINGIEFDDVTFCRASKKIILYQGCNFGPSEYRMDYKLLKAILYQCSELGWRFTDGESVQNSEKQSKM